MRWTIRRKLMLSISIPLLITYLLVLGWDYHRQRAIVTTFMQDLMLTRARLMVNAINTKLEQAQDLARATASAAAGNVMTVQGNAGESVRIAVMPKADWVVAGLVAMPSPAGGVRMMVVHAPPGENVTPVQKEVALNGDEAWYTAVMQTGRAGWFGPMPQPGIVDSEVVMYATPVQVQDRIVGVGAVLVPPESFRQVSLANQGLLPVPASAKAGPIDVASLIGGSFDDFVVVSPTGQVICRPVAFDTFQAMFNDPKLRDSEMAGAFLKAAAGEGSVVLAQSVPGNPQDDSYWATFCPIPATGWVFSAVVPESAVMRPILLLMAQRAGLLLAGLALMLCVVYFVSVRMSAPIERLAMAQRKVGEGDLQAQAGGTSGSDELAELARGFNGMVGQIRQQIEEIRIAAAAQERADGELRVARSIQAALLPKGLDLPPDAGFELCATNAAAHFVAGDFYDFFLLDKGRLMVVIADVSGKGVPAAILMAVTRTIVRNLAVAGKGPAEIVRQVNRMLVQDSPENMFVTMIVGEYDIATGVLRFINAGHPPMILTTPGTPARMLEGSTAPLVGASDDWPDDIWCEATLPLAPGETVVLYTDGVTEAHNAAGELLGDARAVEIVQACTGRGASAMCQHITGAVERYEGPERSDDLTVLVLKRSIS